MDTRPKPSIDIGLAISGALLGPGERRLSHEIAAFCDCSTTRIQQIEKKALKKLRIGLSRQAQAGLREELKAYLP